MISIDLSYCYGARAHRYDSAHSRWLRYAGGEAQCAFEGAVSALLKPGYKVLDVACGRGDVARRILSNEVCDIDLTLVDRSQRMLAACNDIPATRVAGCMTDLPLQDDQFDLVTCAWGIEVLSDPSIAIQEFMRVTRANGHLCLVFCADRPARSLMSRVLRSHVVYTNRGQFLDPARVGAFALSIGALHVQRLFCTGPAAAMIIQV